MTHCERCGALHDGTYGSGRFCAEVCSRSFSTVEKRKEINAKVSATLQAKSVFYEKTCPVCSTLFKVRKGRAKQRTCSPSCGLKLSHSNPNVREKLSLARTKAIQEGKTNFTSIKCYYPFSGEHIRCDSKIEYACLNYFETRHGATEIARCTESIVFDDEGVKRRFTPDFVIETPEGCYLIECKSSVPSKRLNAKWRRYNELAEKKRVLLDDFASQTGRKPFWFTKDIHLAYYRSVVPR